MSNKAFKKIGVVGKINASATAQETLIHLIQFLASQQKTVVVEERWQLAEIRAYPVTYAPMMDLLKQVDLLIVIGGDGSLLNAAQHTIRQPVPILGINRGRLGFLTDISPEAMEQKLLRILQGDYASDIRTLLHARVLRAGQVIHENTALNDVVLFAGEIARMIEFEIRINQQFVARLRGDGLITSTATGSTAYALSAGGPILHPHLPAFALVPMHPHILSARPLVVDQTANIQLIVTHNNQHLPKLSCDGQTIEDIQLDDVIEITKYPKTLTLIHPSDYCYYDVLRTKLGWSTIRTS